VNLYSEQMDAAQRQLSDEVDQATQRLLGTAREIADSELRQPSLLPGWTRAYVLAHLARGADAMRYLLVGARSGEDRPAYASEQEWAAATEYTAGLGTKELAADVAASAMALRTISRQLPDDAWRFPLRLRDSGPFPAAEVLTRRLVEVELHHCDLGAGYGPGDWPAAFAAMELAEPMRSLREDRLRRAQQASSATG
jgi:maleylpyruvate isomerase